MATNASALATLLTLIFLGPLLYGIYYLVLRIRGKPLSKKPPERKPSFDGGEAREEVGSAEYILGLLGYDGELLAQGRAQPAAAWWGVLFVGVGGPILFEVRA